MLQPKVLDVAPLSDYKVMLSFDTGEQKIFDVAPYWIFRVKSTACTVK